MIPKERLILSDIINSRIESEMREFGKVYNGKDDVYIKIRVELLNLYGATMTFVMSFHFAEKPFTKEMFP